MRAAVWLVVFLFVAAALLAVFYPPRPPPFLFSPLWPAVPLVFRHTTRTFAPMNDTSEHDVADTTTIAAIHGVHGSGYLTNTWHFFGDFLLSHVALSLGAAEPGNTLTVIDAVHQPRFEELLRHACTPHGWATSLLARGVVFLHDEDVGFSRAIPHTAARGATWYAWPPSALTVRATRHMADVLIAGAEKIGDNVLETAAYMNVTTSCAAGDARARVTVFVETRASTYDRRWTRIHEAIDAFVAFNRRLQTGTCFRFVLYDARDVCISRLVAMIHAHADAMVGVHGAGNTNAIFMDRARTALLVQVLPEPVCAWSGALHYRTMAVAAGVGYQTFCVPATRSAFFVPVDAPFLAHVHRDPWYMDTQPEVGQKQIYNTQAIHLGASDIKQIADAIVSFRASKPV